MALPEFQRGYVWIRDQVRAFFHSMYRQYPVGSFLTWSTAAATADTRGGVPGKGGAIRLLLDGQQRVTTLYGVARGRPPKFFEGRKEAHRGPAPQPRPPRHPPGRLRRVRHRGTVLPAALHALPRPRRRGRRGRELWKVENHPAFLRAAGSCSRAPRTGS
ncbi:DUF262 domain-containing protein [Streptomyces sp. 2.9]|uniref:DUF262 domain-containing protein n=1 Tax=Streptomyces tritrimontium TaxID=3406573 RepID=UPI003BB75E30